MPIDQRIPDPGPAPLSRTASELDHILKSGRIPNALLFWGKKGGGKTAAAVRFVKACNCKKKDHSPCNLCISCKKIDTGMHPDVIRISVPEEKKSITIAQIRKMGLAVTTRPHEARWRMILIQDAELMNHQAQNALLKVLEEPPDQTFFILTATRTAPFLPTILSRCRQIRFTPPACDQVISLLISRYGVSRDAAAIAVRTADAGLDKAVMYLGMDREKERQTNWPHRRIWIIQELVALLSRKHGQAVWQGLYLSQRLCLEPDLIADSMAIIRTVLRDLCIFPYGPEKIVNLDFFDPVKDISQMHCYKKCLQWMDDLYETEKRLASNSSPRLTLDRFFLKFSL